MRDNGYELDAYHGMTSSSEPHVLARHGEIFLKNGVDPTVPFKLDVCSLSVI